MSSIESSPKPKEKASSKNGKKAARAAAKSGGFSHLLRSVDLDGYFSREALEFDLLSQLTHMSAVSTSGIQRALLFEGTAGLSYSTSKFFRQVHLVAQRLNYDYSRACEVVADTVKDEAVRNLLLHFATSLSSGEPEEHFLEREASLQRETYGKSYERKIETLQKWSDAYIALMVSATLIVVISLVSMMIYPFSPVSIIGLAGLMVCVTFVGGWLIFTVSPVEVKTHSLKHKSPEADKASSLARFLVPGATIAGLGVGFMFGLGPALIAAAIVIAPVGIMAMRDDWRIDARDRDISSFIRAMGAVMGSAGITVTDGLTRLNRRALGSLEPNVRRLYLRLKNGISPDLSWLRLASESGSELVTRCVRVFWDGVRMGGDTEKVATLASEFALKIHLLRQDRKLVATTFSLVVVPLHIVLLGIMLFVTEVVQVFGEQLAEAQQAGLQDGVVQEAGVSQALLFQAPALSFVPVFVGTVALMLTAANSFAPYAAVGGNKLKLFMYAAVMMMLSGLAMLTVPYLVRMVFESVATTPAEIAAAPTQTPFAP